ncbi:MAG: WYL domain-containing protein [Acidimicrobiales bacterium]
MGSSDNPTVKVLRTLALLQQHPGITAAEIADRLDVTDRAVRRYVALLREADIPINSTKGRHGGYRIGRSLRPMPLVFTAGESLGLVMAVLDGHHAAADADDPVGSALAKLIGSLPGLTARHAAMVRDHARAAPDRRAARPDPAIVSALVETVANHRGARVDYVAGSGETAELRIDPWAIVVRHGRWYLLCLARDTEAARALRIDRIRRLDPLNVDVEPPVDLNPVEWLENHLATGWNHEVIIDFDAPAAEVAPWIQRSMGRLEAVDDSRCRLRGTTSNPAMYAGEWLAGVPHAFHVVEGRELRSALVELAERLLTAADPARDQLL